MQKNNIIIAIIIVCIILVGLVFYATNMNTDSDNATKDGNNSSINLTNNSTLSNPSSD